MKTITQEQLLALISRDGKDVMLRFEYSFSFSYIDHEERNTITFRWTDGDGYEYSQEVDISKPLEVRGCTVLLPNTDDPGIISNLEIYVPVGSTKTLDELMTW